jgi:hypothetical protein
MNISKWPVLSIVKYGALLLFFGLGYQFASKEFPQASAIVGWAAGFLVGLKLHLVFANRNS